MIRESALTSATLYRLSNGAERLFWRMTLIADDYGRFEADAQVLKAKCFPLWPDAQLSVKKVSMYYAEMEVCGLVVSYTATGKYYGHFPTWETHQRIRAKSSKYPAPSDDNICQHALADAAVVESRSRESKSRVEVETTESRESKSESKSEPPGFARFWELYPHKVGKTKALEAWSKHGLEPKAEEVFAGLDRTMVYVTREGGKWIPHPTTWLNQGRWKDEPRIFEPVLMDKTSGNAEAARRFAGRRG